MRGERRGALSAVLASQPPGQHRKVTSPGLRGGHGHGEMRPVRCESIPGGAGLTAGGRWARAVVQGGAWTGAPGEACYRC